MQIQLQARDFPLTEALVDYVERSINFELSSRYEQIRRIAVRLSEAKGSRGRVDKHCQIQVSLPRCRDIVIDASERDLYVAIERAIHRAGRTVNRRLKRQFFKKRKLFVPHKDKPLVLLGSH
ncbi:MAG: HPF/RaiA family ribosome-associated protein [Gammaproteobacteria bacterium]|jgi:putative sigma-54 modulation protein